MLCRFINNSSKLMLCWPFRIHTAYLGCCCNPHYTFWTVLEKNNIHIRFNTVKKTEVLLTSNKGRIPRLPNSGIYEYQFQCAKSYIEQTERNIQCRITITFEGRSIGSYREVSSSHHPNDQHNINFDDTKILEKNTHYYLHIIRESLAIMKNPNNLTKKMIIAWKLEPRRNPETHNFLRFTNNRKFPRINLQNLCTQIAVILFYNSSNNVKKFYTVF